MIRFKGMVCEGIKKFSKQLILPNRDQLSIPIQEWPEIPQPGTLNIKLDDQDFPPEFLKVFGRCDLRALDSRQFAPEAELLWTEIGGNTLPPTRERPDRGNAQIWRACVRKVATREERVCWVLRRIGSTLVVHLELVAGVKLRDALSLVDGTPVEVDVEGKWS